MSEFAANIDHEDLRALVALAEIGTLSGAARLLGVSHATIGRRISALEQSIDSTLFERTNGRFVLTEQGEQICHLAREIVDRMLALQRAAVTLSTEISGLVRVTSTEGVGAFLLSPLLAKLTRNLPAIDFTLTTSDANLSLAHREADIALRFGLPETGQIVGRRVANIGHYLYATPDYLAQTKPADYAFIAGPESHASLPGLDVILHALKNRRFAFRSNSMTGLWAAARAGLGIALLPRFIGDAAGDLIRVDIDAPEAMRELWLLTHRDVKDVPRIRAVADLLYDRIYEKRVLLD